IIADIHHQYRMALAAMEAGVHGLRLNPGNIRKPEHIKAVAAYARSRQSSIRIGVNGGSLDPSLYEKYGGITPEAMVESAQREMEYFHEVDFDLIKISVKASSVPLMVEAYRQLSEVTDVPLHLGVTEAGPPPGGLVKATAGIATLLMEGIGDTIRYSLTADLSQKHVPGANCSRHSACASARTSISSPAPAADAPRSTSSTSPIGRCRHSVIARSPSKWRRWVAEP